MTMKLTALACAVLASSVALAQRPQPSNMIFFHPDGFGPNHFAAARIYWYGPDAISPWDTLPFMAAYRGHMEDLVQGTSNGGATTHAFGYKVEGLGSFGKDGNGLAVPPTDRFIRALSGYPGSVLREAAFRGHPIGVVNDGHIGEPGTGAFLAEVGNRNDWDNITLQIVNGRPGFSDPRPVVIMGGGEEDYLPTGTMGTHGAGTRTDGRNLINELSSAGYTVLRTRADLMNLRSQLIANPALTPRVVGVFARFHLFNDRNEENLIAGGFVNPSIPATDKRSNLVLFGSNDPTSPSWNPPTVAEMSEVAMMVLDRHSRRVRRPFALVIEPESTDNFGNSNNAIGTLTAGLHSNQMIEAFHNFRRTSPNTTILTAADSDASGMQIIAAAPGLNVGNVGVNGATGLPTVNNPLDGMYGRNTIAFQAANDQFGKSMAFGVAWSGGPDFSGGVITRAAGPNAEILQTHFSGRFDNVDVYRFMYYTLFGNMLPYPHGQAAPNR